MANHQTGDKPLSKAMVMSFGDTCMPEILTFGARLQQRRYGNETFLDKWDNTHLQTLSRWSTKHSFSVLGDAN